MVKNSGNLLCVLIAVHCFGLSVVRSDIPRPRGVAPAKASLYPVGETFTCFDRVKTIKYTQINDDYCDCLDGSDEPGTSACPNGVFHCVNAGHKAQDFPSSRVNDNICDCCDASDEYASKVKCVNNCSELGKEEKHREKQRVELAKIGNQLRAELSAKGKAQKEEQRLRLDELKNSIGQAQSLKDERELIRKDAESYEAAALEVYREVQGVEKAKREEQHAHENRQEAETIFAKYDSNGDGVVDVKEIQVRVVFDQDRDGQVTVDEAKYFLDDHEQVDLETFITLCWPKIKPFLMLDSGLFKPPANIDELRDDKKTFEDIDAAADSELADLELEGEDENDQEHEQDDDGEYEAEEEETGVGSVSGVNSSSEQFMDPFISG